MASKQLVGELKDFVLPNVNVGDKELGVGSYGRVVEVAVPGAICAAKFIHRSLVSDETETYVTKKFAEECRLMSTLRHPNIVQFLGLCVEEAESPFPGLVMERLRCSLDDILTKYPPTKQVIPLSLKCSILQDVARGLFFLHCHSPPIVHRDLSARNVLLNSAMEAKLADFGVARIVDTSSMTSNPGTLLYMPPEAMESNSYRTSIDVFSFGHLTLFTLTQVFPKVLKASTYTVIGKLIPRSEVERREEYFTLLESQLPKKNHSLIKMTKECLANVPEKRPSIEAVLKPLESVKSSLSDNHEQSTKLDLILAIEEHKKEVQRAVEEQRKKEMLLQEHISLKQGTKIVWKKMGDMSFGIERAFTVVLNGKLYVGGGDTDTELNEHNILEYDPEKDDWREFAQCPAKEFAMTSFQSELVVVGGRVPQKSDAPGRMRPSIASRGIMVWNKHSHIWHEPYPPMPESRWLSSAVGYRDYLVVISGKNYDTGSTPGPKTAVYDNSLRQWFLASPVPITSRRMSVSLLSDTLFAFSGGSGNQAFTISIPDLMREVKQPKGASPSLWKKVPCTLCSVTAENFMGRVIVAGGSEKIGGKAVDRIWYYNPASRKWEDFTKQKMAFKLPVPRSRFAFAAITERQIIVAGGYEVKEREYRKDVYIGTLTAT